MREIYKMGAIKVYNFKTCCSCLSLRTGCIIVITLEILLLLILNLSVEWSTFPIAIIIGNVVALAFIVYLFYGIFMENHTHLRWWIISNHLFILMLVVLCGLCIYNFINSTQHIESSNDRPQKEIKDGIVEALLAPIIEAIVGAILLYMAVAVAAIAILQAIFSWIVYSYICELRVQENRENARLALQALKLLDDQNCIIPV